MISKDTLGIRAPKFITSKVQHDRYINELVKWGSNPRPSRDDIQFMRLLGLVIEQYENQHFKIADATPREVLSELMAANGLRRKDLVPQFGSESMVSRVLSGKRKLTVDHAVALGHRFKVSPAAFIPC